MALKKIFTQIHEKTKRNYLARMVLEKKKNMKIQKQKVVMPKKRLMNLKKNKKNC